MRKTKSLPALVCILICICVGVRARAAGTIYDSPYVSFSPDGQAWTTNAGDRGIQWYSDGEEIHTGLTSAIRQLKAGEHFYKTERKGVIPVGKWKVSHVPGKCIHPSRPGFNYWHGQSFGETICKSKYYSGWLAYCADCDEAIFVYIYMSREAARSISYLPTDMEYYYLCPFCTHIEQGAAISHICKKISMNRYKVIYNKNSVSATGYMQDDIFMYDNAEEYEGKEVAPKKRLSKNSFSRTGYRFVGWNTERDGSGTFFSDEQEILNLSEENWNKGDESTGVVTLYACWELSESTLIVDPNGGTYDGSSQPVVIRQPYGTSFDLQSKDLVVPPGYKVSFETNGGEKLDSVRSTGKFLAWEKGYPFYGKLTDSVYYFIAPEDSEDTVICTYQNMPVILPTPKCPGKEFGGWYLDEDMLTPVGMGGDEYLPTKDTVLYAAWVDLSLTAINNYVDNNGAGAVDLSWVQGGKEAKSYKLYQSTDRVEWNQIVETTEDSQQKEKQTKLLYNGGVQKYEVRSNGFYKICAAGAQGSSVLLHTGGQGSVAEGLFWLSKGDILEVCIGGQTGYPDGGKSLEGQGNGGGSTQVTRNGTALVIAAGGGGASYGSDGEPGGSSTGQHPGSIGKGEDGYSGGGAGCVGGMAGQIIYHTHSEKCGMHTHTLDCSTRHTHTSSCYRFWTYNTGNEPRVDLPCGCRTQIHHFACTKCGRNYQSQTWNGTYCKVGHYGNSVVDIGQSGCCPPELECRLTEGYFLICRYEEGYQCGLQEGVSVERITAAYGGSSFVAEQASLRDITVGGNVGDGYVLIEPVDVGYMNTNEKKGVPARDLKAPDKIDIKSVNVSGTAADSLSVAWDRVKDHGTIYYHKAQSFRNGDDTLLCESNITRNELCVGVKGYYVLKDTVADTIVTEKNGRLILTEQYSLPYNADELQTIFVHIAAVDMAGNIGETEHIKINSKEDIRIYWGVFTDKISISNDENVYYLGDDTWYIRADGETPVTLRGSCCLTGTADESYRPTTYGFLVDKKPDTFALINTADVGWPYPENLIAENQWRTRTAGEFPLGSYPYIKVQRSATGERLSAERSFLAPESLHGETVILYPYGAVTYEDKLIESDSEEDHKNGIILRGDGKGPIIQGTNLLEERGIEAFLRGEYELEISALDSDSGLNTLTATLYSDRDKLTETVTTGSDGKIRIRAGMFSEDLWNDTVVLTVEASDNVGNMTRQEFHLEDLWVTATVTRILPPHAPVFRGGESGLLTIRTGGNAERLEIIFPKELTDLDSALHCDISLASSEYSTETPRMFMVPLYAPPADEYRVKVIAYKGDRSVETTTSFCVQGGGTVLDEIRTRLR